MNESKRTSQVLKRFRELYPDGVAWKFNDRIGRSRPDVQLIRRQIVWIEFKMPDNDLTAGQELELDALNDLFPGRVFVGWFQPPRKGKKGTILLKLFPEYRWTHEFEIDEFCRYFGS